VDRTGLVIPVGGGAALIAGLVAWAAAAVGQALPPCAPERTLGVTLTSEERGGPAPLVATHDASLTAWFTGTTLSETYTPPPGAR
jgi:hypothetical protein